MITNAIDTIGTSWSLCFIGEDQASKLGALTNELKRGVSETGDGKQIASGFSYWGIGPTIAWLSACKDHLYPVMNQSITNFSALWSQTVPDLKDQKYHYVSLGVGSGEKDNLILRDLLQVNSGLYYVPVDMSPEMLRVGARDAIKGIAVERSKILPVQIDFSFQENVAELRNLLHGIVGESPILYSLLGNTLSNFDFDSELLQIIALLIRPQDRLLLEVAFANSLNEEAQTEAAEEYNRSRMFKEFVTSSLLQNTDLQVDIENVDFASSIERDRAILIKAIYRNKTGNSLRVTLPDRTTVQFSERDTIRLLTMRKYTDRGIGKVVEECGFSCVRRVRKEFSNKRKCLFGTELLFLLPSAVHKAQEPYMWDIFLAHAGPDAPIAKELYDLLSGRCKIFLDSENLDLGDDWDRELSTAQRRALITVVLVSGNTGEAYYQREEIAAAIRMARKDKDRHRVVPVFLEGSDVDNPPYGLEAKHGVRISTRNTLKDLSDNLVRLIGKSK